MPDESTEQPPSEANQLRSLLGRLTSAGAEFLVIGGRAEQIMGGTRNTYDSDLCIRRTPDNLKRIVLALKDLNPRPRDFPPKLPFVFDERTLALGATFTLETDVGKVDLLGEVEPLGSYDDLLARAETYLIDDREVRTIGLEDLIRVKEFIGRAKDQASLDQLYAIRQLRNEEQLR